MGAIFVSGLPTSMLPVLCQLPMAVLESRCLRHQCAAPLHLWLVLAAAFFFAALEASEISEPRQLAYAGYQIMPHHEQCKNPLYQTQWAGKNDIQTLRAFPTVKTNLKKCPAYNQMASCCDQTFESEQTKFYSFWRQILVAKLARSDTHRRSVADVDVSSVSVVDRQQWQLALDRYAQVLEPRQHSECLTSLMTYVAGMICFSCKPNWFHYTLMSGDTVVGEHTVRVRIRPAACVEIWASCGSFSRLVQLLRASLRDSRLARTALRSEEDLGMFTEQQLLCDWMHDQVGLHPFRLPTKEEGNVGLRLGDTSSSRRLEMKMELDVMHDGRASGFDRAWVGELRPSVSSCLRRSPWQRALVILSLSVALS